MSSSERTASTRLHLSRFFEYISFLSDCLYSRLGFYRGDLLPDAADVPLYNGRLLPRLASERDAQQFFGRYLPPWIVEKIGDDL